MLEKLSLEPVMDNYLIWFTNSNWKAKHKIKKKLFWSINTNGPKYINLFYIACLYLLKTNQDQLLYHLT